MRRQNIKQKTLNRLQVIAKPHETVDDALNRIIDSFLGFECEHKNTGIYMKVATDKKGYVDISATLIVLDEIRHGKSTTKLIRVCENCLKGRKVN